MPLQGTRIDIVINRCRSSTMTSKNCRFCHICINESKSSLRNKTSSKKDNSCSIKSNHNFLSSSGIQFDHGDYCKPLPFYDNSFVENIHNAKNRRFKRQYRKRRDKLPVTNNFNTVTSQNSKKKVILPQQHKIRNLKSSVCGKSICTAERKSTASRKRSLWYLIAAPSTDHADSGDKKLNKKLKGSNAKKLENSPPSNCNCSVMKCNCPIFKCKCSISKSMFCLNETGQRKNCDTSVDDFLYKSELFKLIVGPTVSTSRDTEKANDKQLEGIVLETSNLKKYNNPNSDDVADATSLKALTELEKSNFLNQEEGVNHDREFVNRRQIKDNDEMYTKIDVVYGRNNISAIEFHQESPRAKLYHNRLPENNVESSSISNNTPWERSDPHLLHRTINSEQIGHQDSLKDKSVIYSTTFSTADAIGNFPCTNNVMVGKLPENDVITSTPQGWYFEGVENSPIGCSLNDGNSFSFDGNIAMSDGTTDSCSLDNEYLSELFGHQEIFQEITSVCSTETFDQYANENTFMGNLLNSPVRSSNSIPIDPLDSFPFPTSDSRSPVRQNSPNHFSTLNSYAFDI